MSYRRGPDAMWELKYYPGRGLRLVFAADFPGRLEMGSQQA